MAGFTLPNGVVHNGKHYKFIELEEMRGRHQNLLVNPSPKTPIDHIVPLLKDLIISIKTKDSEDLFSDGLDKLDVINNYLPVQDIQFILVKIRLITFDPTYLMDLECEHCGHMNKAKLDLSTLEVSPAEEGLPKEKRITPKSKKPFDYGHLTLTDMRRGMFVEDDKGLMDNLITEMTSFLLVNLDGKENPTSEDLEDLPAKDIAFIQDNVSKKAEIDLIVEHTCSKCEEDFSSDLNVLGTDFLLPSRT